MTRVDTPTQAGYLDQLIKPHRYLPPQMHCRAYYFVQIHPSGCEHIQRGHPKLHNRSKASLGYFSTKTMLNATNYTLAAVDQEFQP